ncbi:MAG TPA: thermonuclease family protein [Sandaracinaceae bacterium LLY-WYZ-13_1]|nr:thermonuclease family protein [Sandaracinaceae bacterium LLY-WYZ-13_1]
MARWIPLVAACALMLAGCPRKVGGDDAGPDATDAGYDPEVGNRFTGPLVLDDARMEGIDPSALRAGSAPCRAPILGRVFRVADGDTISVEGLSEVVVLNVRMIGVDTPEVAHEGMPAECYGDEAADFTRQLEGHLVWLTFDEDCTDRFDRTLAYVHVGTGDGDLFERQLLRRGFANVLTIGGNDAYATQFRSDESAAASENAGLWGFCL